MPNFLRVDAGADATHTHTHTHTLLRHTRAQLRAYTHLTETLNLPSTVGEAVHQSLVQSVAFGLGDKYIASLITSQELLTGVKISTLPPFTPPKKF